MYKSEFSHVYTYEYTGTRSRNNIVLVNGSI